MPVRATIIVPATQARALTTLGLVPRPALISSESTTPRRSIHGLVRRMTRAATTAITAPLARTQS